MKEIYHRASIRKFLDQKVEKEHIEEILRAAMAAPSAMNQRAWEFYVVEDKDMLLKLSEVTPYSMCIKNAPAAIVVCYKEESSASIFLQIDCALAVENILLTIDSLGLGGVMIGVAPDEEKMKKLEETLSMPKDLKAFTIIPFGYPAVEKEQPDRYEESKVHWV